MDKLKSALQFLALSRDQKKKVLPQSEGGKIWEIFGTPIQTDHPLLCMTYECWRCLDHLYENLDSEEQQLIAEIRTVLNLMIELPVNYEPIWTVCDANRLVEVDAEQVWEVVERLAKTLLQRLGWPQVVPQLKFEDFITVGRAIPKGT